ncbi:UDP-N-acetylmuramate--L-alanine ligase [Desulfovirgula thermocuniculi]|uniref:UDP-N-acetylmuramate--L-alanine ligase n=1 Tax=Desulfovirgula thermocuniculi TaxID=348842 RepID=UPI000556AA77|nr:UDP-N-acetylmuramate--L-alanine ligase [Desulfovirgula thermocuniculi]
MHEIPAWVHFIGIGGAGMSALASILLDLGHKVSGSDLAASKATTRLASRGAVIYFGHDPRHLGAAQMVVVSSAIKPDNPELVAARERNLPVVHRGELLAWLMKRQKGIAVAGAHGKTTTTSMLSLILERAGRDPTVIVGGELDELGGNAKLGRGDYLVAEADESDGSFLKLDPLAVLVTNIEDDHLDYYGSLAGVKEAFRRFMGKVPPTGAVVACGDDPNVREAVGDLRCRVITYGCGPGNDYTLRTLDAKGRSPRGEVYYQGKYLGILELSVPGEHNLLNALGAVAAARWAGVDFPAAAAALKEFRGVKRRFQPLGEVGGVAVVDDYAHHPTEIKATLRAARQLAPRRLVVVFQPHRYTRTALLHDRFGGAFEDADLLLVDEIYGAGEDPLAGVDARLIVRAVTAHGRPPVIYLPGREAIVSYLLERVLPGDLVMFVGAGNVWTYGVELVKRLKEKAI